MNPVPPKKKFLSQAALVHHNKATKRPMLQKDISQEEPNAIENYPSVQRSCSAKCKQPGCQFMTIEERQFIYKTFFIMTDDEKYMFQSLLMSSEDPAPEPGSKARMSWTYKLPVMYAKVDVCQTTFRTTLGVSDSQVGRIQKRMVEKNEICPRNMRGRHDNRPHRLIDETIDLVKEHLESYDPVENHYTRNKYDETMSFLPSFHTIKRLHLDYIDVHGTQHPVSESTFRTLFHGFHFKIGNPYDDTCDTCDYLQLKIQGADNDAEKTILRTQKQVHLSMADLTSNARKSDIAKSREDRNYIVLSVDMQQTFFTPKLTNASAFYLRKFCTYNLGIHDENNDRGHMFLWNETDAKKGADEVASCIHKFITSMFQPICAERSLVVWSDRAVGQNNNYTMLVLYRKLIQDGYFSNVYQKFAVSGHSYLSCDTDFSFIERQLKKRPPLTPNDLLLPIQNANSVTPFQVYTMTKQDFYDSSFLSNYWRRPADLKVSQFHQFFQHKAFPNKLLAKNAHSDTEDWRVFEYKFRNKALEPWNIPAIDAKLKYTRLLPLKESKQSDLGKMMKFLCERDRAFFQPFLDRTVHSEELEDTED